VKLTPKLSQPELDGPPQSEDVDAGMNCPVQVTRVLASDTEPEAGFAPRVIGITITAMHAANRHNDAASAYLALVVAETFRVFRSFLSMSSSPSVLANQQAFRTISAIDEARRGGCDSASSGAPTAVSENVPAADPNDGTQSF